ncbi:hypothetical protein EBESD8_4110 [Rhodococcus aetherivorans]|nr:hypothetical protein EBESD8_4110 [Rhodococcus aetherivorans]
MRFPVGGRVVQGGVRPGWQPRQRAGHLAYVIFDARSSI